MRWPFGRSSRPDAGPTTPATGAGDRPPIDRPHDAWRSLPAVQRTTGEPPTVAPAAPFAASLATRRPPALALAPLGHEVSPLGSAGIVVGLTAPSGAALTSRIELPVQRSAAEAGREPAESPGWSSFDSPAPGPVTPGPGQSAPAVPADVAGQPLEVQRIPLAAPAMTRSASTSVPAAPAGRFDLRPGSVRPASTKPDPTLPAVQPSAIQPGPAPAPSPDQPARRPTLGQARRLGLGVPLSPGGEQAVQRIALALPVARGSDQAIGTVTSSSPRPGSMREAVAGSGQRSLLAGEPRGSAANEAAPIAARREPPALTVVRPISVQRLAPALPDAPGDPRPADEPLVAGGLSLPPPAGRLEPTMTTIGAPEPGDGPAAGANEAGQASLEIQRLLEAPLGGSPIRVSAAGSLLQAASVGESPHSAASRADRTARTDEPVVARAIVDGGRSVAFAARPAAATVMLAGPAPRTPSEQPSVLRMVASARPAAIAPDNAPGAAEAAQLRPVQRAVQINELQVNANVPDPVSGGSANGTGASQGTGMGTTSGDKDRELDDLARRLYSRIRARLSAELLADRERSGVLTDLR